MDAEWRVACVRVPRFAIGAVWSTVPERGSAAQLALPFAGAFAKSSKAEDDLHWDERPIALVDGGRLRAVTAAAGRLRLRAGMTVSEARAKCADLEIRTWDDAAVERAVTKATAALLVASPQVTPVAGAPGMWWVGAGGMDGIGGERSLVRTLVRVARLWHPRPRVAVASSCVAARAATWGEVGAEGAGLVRLVARGRCAEYLAPAPLGLIPMDDELRMALVGLGLRTVGAFAALAVSEVERRWGDVGLAAWRLARGEDRRRPVLARSDARRMATAELATPTATMEPVLFLVRAALDRLTRDLVADGRAAATLSITLTLDDGRGAMPAGGVAHTVTREVRPARPLARPGPLFDRCRALLDKWTLTAPVCGVTVAVVATAPLGGDQGELLDSAWRDPEAVEAALERLRAELGPNVVVRPVARDAHRPERAGAWEESEIEGFGGRRALARSNGALPNESSPSSSSSSHSRSVAMGSMPAAAPAAGAPVVPPISPRLALAASDAEAQMPERFVARMAAEMVTEPEVRAAARSVGGSVAGPVAGSVARPVAEPVVRLVGESLAGMVAGGPPPDYMMATDRADCTTIGMPASSKDCLTMPRIASAANMATNMATNMALSVTSSDCLTIPRSASVPASGGIVPHTGAVTRSLAALRLLEQPEVADVECGNGVPVAVRWRERRLTIERASGPERLSGDWWSDGYARDYWRCEGDAGELLLFRDRATAGRWYVQGWWD